MVGLIVLSHPDSGGQLRPELAKGRVARQHGLKAFQCPAATQEVFSGRRSSLLVLASSPCAASVVFGVKLVFAASFPNTFACIGRPGHQESRLPASPVIKAPLQPDPPTLASAARSATETRSTDGGRRS